MAKVLLNLPADVNYFPGGRDHDKEAPAFDQVLLRLTKTILTRSTCVTITGLDRFTSTHVDDVLFQVQIAELSGKKANGAVSQR